MKFSVIIPVYNLEDYVTRCLESFTEQDFDPDDFELVIVNDGSTDRSLEIIEEFANRCNNYNFRIYTKENGGLSSARNFGLSKAEGIYIWFVDGDDWVPKDSLKKLYTYLSDMPSLEILEFECQLAIDTDHGLIYKGGINIDAKSDVIETGREYLENHEYSLGVTVKIYRRDFLLSTKVLFPEGKYSEDNLFSLKTLLYAEKYYRINEVFYFYYQRQNSITKTKTSSHLEKYYNDIFDNILEMKRIVGTESHAVQKTISRMISFFVLLMMLDLFKNKKYTLMKMFAKKIKKNKISPLPDLEMNYINVRKFKLLRTAVNFYLKMV